VTPHDEMSRAFAYEFMYAPDCKLKWTYEFKGIDQGIHAV